MLMHWFSGQKLQNLMWPKDNLIIFSINTGKYCSILSVAEVLENQYNIYFFGLILG